MAEQSAHSWLKDHLPRATCKTCGEYMLFPDSHQCPPEWKVTFERDKEDPEEWRTFRASSMVAAAEKFAEWYDRQGDYHIVGGTSADLVVAKMDGTEETRFTVEGETVPSYWATQNG